jgi:1,4-dihydroxy-2-naphthoate octaprenyltransferase
MGLNWQELWLFLRLSKPLFLIGGALFYGMGASIVDYLGLPFFLDKYLLGQALVTFLQLMGQYLHEYFRAAEPGYGVSPQEDSDPKPILGESGLPRVVALYAAGFSLALATSSVYILIATADVAPVGWVILSLIGLSAFFYHLPPFQLSSSGFGELILSVGMVGLIPIFSYTLQTGDLHRLLFMTTTPILALFFAMTLALELPNYAADSRYGRKNLLVRLGWSGGMVLHNLAIIGAIISIIIAYLLGMPLRVALSTVIVLPLSLAQIWQMSRIRRGFPPQWRLLTYNAIAMVGLTTYLEIVGLLVV